MYKLIDLSNSIRRLSDGASIPKDTGNRDYREYLEWLEAGNTPLPAYTEEELQERSKQTLTNTAKSLLASTDWTQTLDNLSNRGQEWVNKWATYRVELRKVINEEREDLPEAPLE